MKNFVRRVGLRDRERIAALNDTISQLGTERLLEGLRSDRTLEISAF
jgi:hypothetical protein